jgi:hypothetical protein
MLAPSDRHRRPGDGVHVERRCLGGTAGRWSSASGPRSLLSTSGTRGLTKEQLIAEAARSTLDELADWTVEADRVLTF